MNQIDLGEIERAVSALSSEDLAKFRTWFAEFDTATWDRQFETDVVSGKLDMLAEKALQDLQQEKCTDL